MGKLNTSRLKQALVDSTIYCAESVIRETHQDVSVSEKHRRKMQEIFIATKRDKQHRITRRAIIILVAALIILLTSCASFYKKIAEFFVTVFENYNKVEVVSNDLEYSKRITKPRVPQKIIDGYKMISEEYYAFSTRTEWRNENDDYIIFTQKPLPYMTHAVDNENSQCVELEINSYKIFYFDYSSTKHCYIWIQDYVFRLETSQKLTPDELLTIIDSVE